MGTVFRPMRAADGAARFVPCRGVLGAAVATTGEHYSSVIANDRDAGDDATVFAVVWGTPTMPAGAVFSGDETGCATITNATDGAYSLSYTLYANGVLMPDPVTGLTYTTATVTVGNVVQPPADTTAPAWTGSTINVTNLSTTGCNVTWPAATDAGSVSYRWRLGTGAWTTTTATSTPISGQAAGATLAFEVQAYDNASTPNYGTTLSKSIQLQQPAPAPDTQAPTWPAGAQISITAGPTTSGYTVTAPAATDDSGSVTYRWTRGGVVQSATGTSYTRTGATPGSTESLTVTALDATGNPSATTLSKSVTLQEAVPVEPVADLITLAQARAYLASLGVDVPEDMLEDALATVATAVPAMLEAGYDGPTMRRVQRMAVALVAAPGGPRRVQSQGAPSGASRSFKYGDQDFSALRRSLRALDRAGTVAQIIGPDPVAVAFMFVV